MTCFVCDAALFHDGAPDYRRCTVCGHETLAGASSQTFILNEPLSREWIEREAALDRFQTAVLRRFSAGRSRTRLVDIGCGAGRFLWRARTAFDHACGVEVTPEAVAFARTTLELDVVQSIEVVPGPIDFATAWHSLEHIPPAGLTRLLATLADKMPAGGRLAASVPNSTSLQCRAFGRRFAFRDVPNHQHQFSPESLDRLLAAHGFRRIAEIRSWTYNAFGWVQSLLNLVVPGHNHLYYRLKRRHPGGSPARDAASVALLPVATAIAMPLAAIEALLPARQAVLTRVYERERSAGPDADSSRR